MYETDAVTEEEAYRQAYELKGRQEETFNKCAFKVIPIGDREGTTFPRRLTLTERITGQAV